MNVPAFQSFFFIQAEDGIRYKLVTGVQTCALPISALGFTLEPFGGTTYRLPSVPALLTERDYAAALMDVLEILRSPAADDVLDEGLPRVFHHLRSEERRVWKGWSSWCGGVRGGEIG